MFENLYDKPAKPGVTATLGGIKQIIHLLCFRGVDGEVYTGFREESNVTHHLEKLLSDYGIKLSEVI